MNILLRRTDMECAVCGKNLGWAGAVKDLKGAIACEECYRYFNFLDKSISNKERREFFQKNYERISGKPELKEMVDEWLNNEPQETIPNQSSQFTEDNFEEPKACVKRIRESSYLEGSVGPRIKGIVNFLWVLNILLVIAMVIVATIAVPDAIYYWPSFEKRLMVFIVSSAVGCLELLLAYVIKIVLEGFAQLISDTRVIKELQKEKRQ